MLLFFGRETIRVESLDILRREIVLQRISLEGEPRIPLEWQTLRDHRERYTKYGVTPFGKMDEVASTWPRQKVEARLTEFAQDFFPHYHGTLTVWEKHWCVAGEQHSVIVRRWGHVEFKAEIHRAAYKTPPYAGESCSMTDIGWACMPVPEFVGLMEHYMGMIADPLAWVDKEVFNEMGKRKTVQEITLKEDG